MKPLASDRLATLGGLLRRLRPGLHCSFCGRGADQVERLVAGASAHICDACIAACVVVLDHNGGFVPTQTPEIG
jgi:hypothetical protein